MGTIFELTVLEQVDLVSALRLMKEHAIRCVAAHAHSQRKTISQADLSGDCCIVLGSEGYGLDAAVLEECDDWVSIPISPAVDSLNVANAAAIFLYEANRQRGKGGFLTRR